MFGKTKVRCLFKIWLALYQVENYLWQRYSDCFTRISGGKDFPEYHRNKSNTDEDLPF